MYLLGYDVGSSSVKASLVDAETGSCVASAFCPKSEAPIISLNPGWAEQEPASWWENLNSATAEVLAGRNGAEVGAIGISYQMHGLVCVDKDLKFHIYDVAPRIGGGTNVHMSVGHPYGNTLWRTEMSYGRRLSMEIRRAIEQERIEEIIT